MAARPDGNLALPRFPASQNLPTTQLAGVRVKGEPWPDGNRYPGHTRATTGTLKSAAHIVTVTIV
jgi:hypothetical protein